MSGNVVDPEARDKYLLQGMLQWTGIILRNADDL